MQRTDYVGGLGPFGAKLAIIGIAPGDEEVRQEKPFVGPSGNILRRDLRDAGISLDECYRTNIFKHKLPGNEFYRHSEIGLDLQEAISELESEIAAVNPNCILGLGDPVLNSLSGKKGINKWRGSIISALGRKAVFTWHPAAELYGEGEGQWKPWQRYVRKFDIKRAVEQAEFPEFNLPSRLLQVAYSSSDVYRFFERNENEPFCAVDIEAIENVPVCIGFSFKSHEGMSIPLWNSVDIESKGSPKKSYSYNLKVSSIPDDDLSYIWKIIAEKFLDTKIKFIGQNFKYDEDKINRLGFYLHSLYWDTLIGSHCISSELPKALAFQQSTRTEEPYHKDEGKFFVPGKDKIEDLFLYNAKDACVTREIFDTHIVDLTEISYGLDHAKWRMQLHPLYLKIDNEGFKTDENQRKYLIYKYAQWAIRLEKEMFELVRPYGINHIPNTRSPKQMSELLYGTLGIPKRAGTGEEVLTSLIANVIKKENQRKICENILEQRRVDKTLGYLKAAPDYDGRMKTTFLITGTENFRTSTNILEPPIRPSKMGWAFQTVSKHGDIGDDLRSILVADSDYIIVNIDQSQAEARVCSLLANDRETLREYDTIDKHAFTAAKFFGGTVNQYSKKILGYECPERFVGKTLRHAYHLDIGKHEAMINVNTDARKYKIPITISEWKASECLRILEKDTPKIKEVFHYEIREALRKDRRLFGTFNSSRYFYADEGRKLWKPAFSFIPQQTVSDKTKDVALRIYKNLRDVRIVVETHDSLTMLIKEKVLDERVEEIQEYFSIPIDFSRCTLPREPLVIPTEVEVGVNYKELTKYRKKTAA